MNDALIVAAAIRRVMDQLDEQSSARAWLYQIATEIEQTAAAGRKAERRAAERVGAALDRARNP